MASDADRPVVLVVDDEEAVADTYGLRLQNRYETRIAYGGEECLETVDEAVDVVLLDRRMPDMPGDVVLDSIREQGFDCRVVMLTAVDPDVEIIEMAFDDYVTKPVSEDEILRTVETMIARTNYGDLLQEYFAVASKRATLETELTAEELRESDEYEQLVNRADALRSELDDLLSDLARYDDFDLAFTDL
jgi:DNA-binding response OmpR family regulator